MSLSLGQAIKVANRQLASLNSYGVTLELLTEQTEEFSVGWVFCYQSARYIRTADFRDFVVGNAPLFVSRSNGFSCFISYHRPLAQSMAAYVACGNPNAQEVSEVRLTGWRKGALSMSAIQSVRQHSAMGLAQAKSTVESCLANQTPIVPVPSVAAGRALILALSCVGFEAHIRYDG
jgi:Immunity protein 35